MVNYASRNLYPMSWKPTGVGRVVNSGGLRPEKKEFKAPAKNKKELFQSGAKPPVFFQKQNLSTRKEVLPLNYGTSTELNRENTLRYIGDKLTGGGNGKAPVPIYTFQGHSDPEVKKFMRGHDHRHKVLEKRRMIQHHAENVPIIISRPLG